MSVGALSELTVEHIELLLAVDKLGVLLKAGAALGMSPSKATRTLDKIRAILGDPCFVTARGKMIPTDYLSNVLPVLQQMIELTDELKRPSFSPALCRRIFRFTSCITEVATVLGGVIPLMMKEAPDAKIDLRKFDNEFDAITSGLADFAIVTAVDLPPTVHALPLYPLDRVVLLRRGHPLTKLSRPLLLEDLRACKRVTITTGRSHSWKSPDQNIFQNERFMESSTLTTSRFFTAWDAMSRTDLISICGTHAAEIASRAYGLVSIPLPSDFEDENPWNTLIWAEGNHNKPDFVWLRKLFAQWSQEEKARMAKKKGALIQKSKSA